MRDGRIRHVRGDRAHPVSRGRLCRKCATAYNGVILDPQARLTAPLRRNGPKGAGALRRGELGGGAGGDLRAPAGNPRRERAQRPLHGHLRAARLPLPPALLQPPRRDGGRPRHDLQQGRPRRAGLPVRHLDRRLRPAHRARRRCDPRVGSQPVGLGAPPARALARRGARRRDRRRPGAHADRGRGRPAPRPVPRIGRRARLRARPRDRARRAARSRAAQRARGRLRGARAAARAVHARVGRGRDRRAVRR